MTLSRAQLADHGPAGTVTLQVDLAAGEDGQGRRRLIETAENLIYEVMIRLMVRRLVKPLP